MEAQAVVAVILVKLIDILPFTFVNISPLTNIPTSLNMHLRGSENCRFLCSEDCFKNS